MKYFRIAFVIFLLRIAAFASAQSSFIEPFKIAVSSNKTTHLIFPFPIKSIDRGSLDILAQKSPGADEVLQLKADHPRIAQTNVTVITVDNKLYSFLVVYDSIPQHLTISFDSDSLHPDNNLQVNTGYATRLNKGEQPDIGTLQETARLIKEKNKKKLGLRASHELMSIRLRAIYIKDDVYYFLFRVSNQSNISFSLENFSLAIKDTKQIKRRATQERAIQPIFQYATDQPVKGGEKRSWVIAVPKFTLEDGKRLYIQFLEKNGGRNMEFEVKNKHLLSAQKL